MSTTFTATQRYPAPATEVYALFSDPGFLQARLDANGGLDPEVVSVDVDGDSVVIVTRQGIPASALPSVGGSFIRGDPSPARTESRGAPADRTRCPPRRSCGRRGTRVVPRRGPRVATRCPRPPAGAPRR